MTTPSAPEKWPYAGMRCPFDATEFQPGDRMAFCPACETPHHAECWDLNEGCTQYGCRAGGAPLAAPRSLAEDVALVIRDVPDSMPCPFCAEPIRVSARKCKHCLEYLDPNLRRRHLPVPPAGDDLPPDTVRTIAVIQTAFGMIMAPIWMALMLQPQHLSLGGLATTAFSMGLLAAGIGLRSGRNWARRLSLLYVAGFTFVMGLCNVVMVFAGAFPGLVILAPMLYMGFSFLRALDSPECRAFCDETSRRAGRISVRVPPLIRSASRGPGGRPSQ